MNDNKNLTVIDSWDIPSKEERETIFNYEHEFDHWHIYTDVPKHARKFEKFIDESKLHRKGYSSYDGSLALIEGYITGGNVTINTKRSVSEKQRQRLRKLSEMNNKRQN